MADRTIEQNEGVESAAQPQFCANNCGFFANPACLGLCSKCFREKEKGSTSSKVTPAALAAPKETVVQALTQPSPQLAYPSQPCVQPVIDSAQVSAPKQTSPSRCRQCKKKVGVMGFKCRCGGMFCSSHRLAEAHNCDFDFKQFERQKIADNNPVVAGEKLERI